MFIVWFNGLSNRSLVITIIICMFLIYVSFTYNSCLISGFNWTLKKNHLKYSSNEMIMLTEIPPLEFYNSNNSGSNSSRKSNNNNNNKLNSSRNVLHVPLNTSLLSFSGFLRDSSSSIVDGDVDNQRNVSKLKYRLLHQTGYVPTRNLPDTLIIGVKKSGTRALLEFIRLHPNVRAAGYEVHFFDRHYQRGLHWYRHHMPYTIEGQLTMEKTPSYFVTKEVPKRVYKMNPFTKLLVVVRDPVTRAISDYTQAASKKFDMKRFENLAFVNGTYSLVDTKWGPVKLGVYARFLEMWLKYFPLTQLLFISGERLIIDPAYEMRRVQDFLNLKYVVTKKHFYFNATKGFPCLLKSESRSMPHCLGKTKGRNHPYIDTEAIERLREFYRPFNERFYQMTGINFGWP